MTINIGQITGIEEANLSRIVGTSLTNMLWRAPDPVTRKKPLHWSAPLF